MLRTIAVIMCLQNLPVTKIVDELIEMKQSAQTDDYCYYDPRQLNKSQSEQLPKNRTVFQDAIVFVVGGGNYIEYQNLMDYVKVNKNWKLLKINCYFNQADIDVTLSNFSKKAAVVQTNALCMDPRP